MNSNLNILYIIKVKYRKLSCMHFSWFVISSQAGIILDSIPTLETISLNFYFKFVIGVFIKSCPQALLIYFQIDYFISFISIIYNNWLGQVENNFFLRSSSSWCFIEQTIYLYKIIILYLIRYRTWIVAKPNRRSFC